MALKTKVTEKFTITSKAGDAYEVEEHTQFTVVKVDGKSQERLGRSYFKTVDGRGVLKNNDDNTYAIPSLNVKGSR